MLNTGPWTRGNAERHAVWEVIRFVAVDPFEMFLVRLDQAHRSFLLCSLLAGVAFRPLVVAGRELPIESNAESFHRICRKRGGDAPKASSII